MTQAVDIVLDIAFDMAQPAKTVIRTNARTTALNEILEAWLSCQIGAGVDPSPPVERETYKIKIGLTLEDDSFCTESDTGNKGLTAGLIMDVFTRLPDVRVEPLSAR